MSYRRSHDGWVRGILVMLAVAVIATAGGLALDAAWTGSAPAGPSQQTCQFLRWEYKSLWPDGGGPPLPAGC